MIEALLHGKLSREQENMEDILTSIVFGTLRLVPPNEGLFPFLAASCDHKRERPLRDFAADEVRYQFWPTWTALDCVRCEPDVVIRGNDSTGRPFVIAVEAKFNSPKSSEADDSSEAPYDQLAKEWDNLRATKRPDESCFLIYLTAHAGFPRQDIEASIRDFRRTRQNSAEPIIYWLTWREIPRVFAASDNEALSSLVCVMHRLGLVFFSGFPDFKHVPIITWDFNVAGLPSIAASEWHWTLSAPENNLAWSFT